MIREVIAKTTTQRMKTTTKRSKKISKVKITEGRCESRNECCNNRQEKEYFKDLTF